MKVYLVIDVGTSSMRGILYDDLSNKLKTIQITTAPTFKGEIVEKNPYDFDNSLDEIMIKISEYIRENNQELIAIILTSQRSSLICLDKNGDPLMSAIMWQDKRSNEIVEELNHYNKKVMNLSGSPLNPVYLAPKISYVKKRMPEIADRTHKYLTIADYIGYRITGEYRTDYTYGSRTSLMNISTKKWDKELLDIFSIEEEKLCKLVSPGDTELKATTDFLGKYSVNGEVTYISAGGDQQCSAVGMGLLEVGKTAISLGTGGYILQTVNSLKNNLEYVTNAYSLNKMYIQESVMPTVASALNWFKKINFKNISDNEFYSTIEELIKSNISTNVLHFPHFQGRGTPDWNTKAKAGFLNIDFSTTSADLLLSLIESIGFEIKNNLMALNKNPESKTNEAIISGGLSNNKEICQIVSDILEINIIKKSDSEATAFGAYLVGLHNLNSTIGKNTIMERKEQMEKDIVFEPNQKKSEYYRSKFSLWNEYYHKLYR